MTGMRKKRSQRVVILVPGFLSPRWLILPLAHHLERTCFEVIAWDHLTLFDDPQSNVDFLSSKLQQEKEKGTSVSIVAHSFGDWIARQALASAADSSVDQWISIAPVKREVKIAQLIHRFTRDHLSEISIMSNRERAAQEPIPEGDIHHETILATWDWFLTRATEKCNYKVTGTHNSILFTPKLWRLVEQILNAVAL